MDTEENITFQDIVKGMYMARDIEKDKKLSQESYYDELVANKADSIKWISFEHLIVGYLIIKDFKNNSIRVDKTNEHEYQYDYHYYKYNQEYKHRKWKKILYLFSVTPENLKCGMQYHFTPRNCIFVIEILKKFDTDINFKKLKNGEPLSKNCELIRMATDGFREIMIDAKKSDSLTKKQLQLFYFVTYDHDKIIHHITKLSNDLKGYFCTIIDEILIADNGLNLMDQLVIYCGMWMDLKRFFIKWNKKWSNIRTTMKDIRNYECGEVESHPESALFHQLYSEIYFNLSNDPDIDSLKARLFEIENSDKQDHQEINELEKKLANLENIIITNVYKKYKVDSDFISFITSWKVKSSYELYKTAKKYIDILNRQKRRNKSC